MDYQNLELLAEVCVQCDRQWSPNILVSSLKSAALIASTVEQQGPAFGEVGVSKTWNNLIERFTKHLLRSPPGDCFICTHIWCAGSSCCKGKGT